MPVYIRKNVNFTPPSLDRIPVEDEDDYVTDPDQLKDTLPQPYRMLDKVLDKIVEDAWEEIEHREQLRIEESRKVRPPQYQSSHELQEYGGATSISASIDGKYIFIGMPNGIVVLEAVNHQEIVRWKEDKVEITKIDSFLISDQIYLLVSLDDMGFARLHIFVGDNLFLVKVLNENQDNATKLIASKFEVSANGEYVGIVLENPETQETWLEIYKNLRDAWMKELETVLAQMQTKETEKKEKEEAPQPPPAEGTTQESGEVPPTAETDSVAQSHDSPREPVIHHTSDKTTSPKFTPPTFVMKIKPPPKPTGSTAPNIHIASQKIDTGEVIGTGQNHIFTSNNMDVRKEVFKHLHDNLLPYLPKEEESTPQLQEANFHFLNAGRMIPYGLDQTESPTTVAVWWKGNTHMMHYSLLKQSKDLERKPDLVWPFTSKITASVTSPDTSLLVVGLENGTLVVWDWYLGFQRGVVNVTNEASIEKLWFLDPSICPQENMNVYPPYGTKTSAYLMILCSDCSMFTLLCGAGIQVDPICTSPAIEAEGEKFTHIVSVPGINNLSIAVLKCGGIQLRDTLQGTIICEVLVPDNYELTTPWEPIITIGGLGQILYVRGTKKQMQASEEEEHEENVIMGSLLVYQIRSFPSLDSYYGKQYEPVPFMLHSTVDKRVEALMKERIAQQGLRKTRMQERWGNLKEEIWTILQYKYDAERKIESRPSYIFEPVVHYQ